MNAERLAEIDSKITAHKNIVARLETQKLHAKRLLPHPCLCAAKEHPLGNFKLVITHYDVGDSYAEGEWRLCCPVEQIEQRLLFNDYDLPYEYRRTHYSGEDQFKQQYRYVFAQRIDRYNETGWWNRQNNISYYIDKHREQFGLRSLESIKHELRLKLVP